MLCHRIKQFRQYNKIDKSVLAEAIGVSVEKYDDFENGIQTPDIETIEKLCRCYKVTVDEFYGYTPRLELHDNEADTPASPIDFKLLQMGDITAEETLLLLRYRQSDKKEEVLHLLLDE